MHDETTLEAVRWRGVRELEKARDAAEEAASRARELHERAETAIRNQNREEVSEWAWEALDDEKNVILSLGTTGLEDPVDIVEAVVLDMAGETLLSERVRPTVEIEEEATAMHGHTAESLADAPTFADVYPRFRESLEGRRVAVYNAEYAGHVLSQVLDRYGLFPPERGAVGCAMIQYARLEGHWSLEEEVYRPVPLPNADGTPEGNARALLGLLRDLAGLTPVPVAPSRNDENLIVDEEDFDNMPF